jgi:hypothetical protein
LTAQGSASRKRRSRTRHPRLAVGERVRFVDGTFAGAGVVDAATKDFSIIWVWTDGGAGRKMFLQGPGTIVESLEDEVGLEPDSS